MSTVLQLFNAAMSTLVDRCCALGTVDCHRRLQSVPTTHMSLMKTALCYLNRILIFVFCRFRYSINYFQPFRPFRCIRNISPVYALFFVDSLHFCRIVRHFSNHSIVFASTVLDGHSRFSCIFCFSFFFFFAIDCIIYALSKRKTKTIFFGEFFDGHISAIGFDFYFRCAIVGRFIFK